MRLFILVIDLHELHLRELLEIQSDQVRNVEVPAFRRTHALKINIRHAIDYFQFAVAGKAVVDGDPAICIFFRGAGAF